MNPTSANGTMTSPYVGIRFDDIPGFEVSWAGPHPYLPGFCFGSEDGRLLFTDELGKALGDPVAHSATGEAINGFAMYGDYLAVSTRADWHLLHVPKTSNEKWRHAIIPGGSHGVISTSDGHFVGPVGLPGLRVVGPYSGNSKTLTIGGKAERSVYFYKAVALRDADRREVLACAARQVGIAVVPFSSDLGERAIQTFGYKGWDVVDVCAISPGSLAAAAIGKDGTIRLFKDVLTDRTPISIRFPGIEGVAYRVLSCRGHLFVLTSKQVCILTNLVKRFLGDELRKGDPTSAMLMPMEAVDMNLCGDQYLLVVRPENFVLRIDIPAFELKAARGARTDPAAPFKSEDAYPTWDDSEMVSGTQSLATVG